MLKKFISRSDFIKNTLTLTIGTIVAQCIPLLIHPFLRRLYTPEDFGAIAIYLSIFSLITIVSSLRYEANIVLPKNKIEAINIVALTFFINFFFSLVIFSSILLFKENIVELIGLSSKYSNYLYILPFATFAFAAYQSMNYWLIREKAFKASTYNKITRRVSEGFIQLLLSILQKPMGLFLGDLFGNIANAIMGARQILKNNFELKFISFQKMFFVFKKYIEYPKYNLLPTLLSNAASLLPFIFINKFYSTELVGYIDLSRLALSIPLIFIASTISQVFFQQTTEKKINNLSIKNDVKNIFYLLLGIITVEIVVISLAGPALFGLVFGKQYFLSGEFSQILVFSFSLNFISSTFSSIFITFGKIKINSLWQIIYFCLIACLYFFKTYSIENFIKIYVIIEVFIQTIYCLIIWNIVNKYEKSILKK